MHIGNRVQKAGILKQPQIFPAIAESEKSHLKELQQATSKQPEVVLNSVFSYLEFLFKPSQILHGFSWPCGYQFVVGGHLIISANQNGNNHTETVLIKSLLGPLVLASYWLSLTY